MRIILNQQEINSAIACRLQELGLVNIDPTSIDVNFKSTRGENPGTEAEVDFSFVEPGNTREATRPAPNEDGGTPGSAELDSEIDSTDPGPSDDDSAPATTSDLFGTD